MVLMMGVASRQCQSGCRRQDLWQCDPVIVMAGEVSLMMSLMSLEESASPWIPCAEKVSPLGYIKPFPLLPAKHGHC
jgi:hypothetical protein